MKKTRDAMEAAVIEAYLAGASQGAAAARFGLHRKTVQRILQRHSIPIRSIPEAPRVLTPDDELHILEEYGRGMSCPKLAAKYGVHAVTIGRTLRRYAFEARSQSDAVRLGRPVEAHSVSPARWQELYWGPAGEYPSVRQLADVFDCDPLVIKRCLDRAGIKRRSRSEQVRLDIKFGRFNRPGGHADFRARLLAAGKVGKPTPPRLTHAQRAEIGRRQRTRVMVACEWCGVGIERIPYYIQHCAYHCCSKECRSPARSFHQRGLATTPRPLIVEKLRELNWGWPYTYERLEKVGKQIGAREPEILELVLEWSERVAAAEPSVKSASGPAPIPEWARDRIVTETGRRILADEHPLRGR
jgi:transposase